MEIRRGGPEIAESLFLWSDSGRLTGNPEVIASQFLVYRQSGSHLARCQLPALLRVALPGISRAFRPEIVPGDSPISSISARLGPHQHRIDAHSDILKTDLLLCEWKYTLLPVRNQHDGSYETKSGRPTVQVIVDKT